jgi:fermentation-respiration switch protein FrsA (DUF1100 family)
MIEKAERTRVTFDSGGVELVGYLHLPAEAAGKLPCVVMGHGFSGTQDRLFVGAERFAGAGFVVLTFDYRNFGESGGKPRQVIDIKGQREDWGAAIRFARTLEGVDPEKVALWGTSLGGTHTIFVAASDPRIAAVVAQIPYAGRPKESVGRTKGQIRHIMWLALKDRVRGWLGLSPLYVPAVGTADEGAVLVDPHAREVTKSLSAGNSLWRNEIAPRVIFDILRLEPLGVAKEVQAPLLVTIAEKDTEAPSYLSRKLAELASRGEVRSYPVSHYEMYRPEVREKVLADQLVFLKKHLADAGRHAS